MLGARLVWAVTCRTEDLEQVARNRVAALEVERDFAYQVPYGRIIRACRSAGLCGRGSGLL
jgi:hypothetical protein